MPTYSSEEENHVTSSAKVSMKKKTVKRAKRQWKKPKGMPKRPLSAYNLFFAEERQRLLQAEKNESANGTTGSLSKPKMGFAGLARAVAAKWKTLPANAREEFQKKSELERIRYKKEVESWERKMSPLQNAWSMRRESGVTPMTFEEPPLVYPNACSAPRRMSHEGSIVSAEQETLVHTTTRNVDDLFMVASTTPGTGSWISDPASTLSPKRVVSTSSFPTVETTTQWTDTNKEPPSGMVAQQQPYYLSQPLPTPVTRYSGGGYPQGNMYLDMTPSAVFSPNSHDSQQEASMNIGHYEPHHAFLGHFVGENVDHFRQLAEKLDSEETDFVCGLRNW